MPFAGRLKARLSAVVPVLTTVVTFGLAGVVHHGDDARDALTGFVQGIPEALSALEPARVIALHVAVGSEVEPHQLIATLDTSVLDGEIAVARAERGRLEAAVRAEQTLQGRRLDYERENIERAATKEREDILRMKAEADALDSELARVRKLVAEHQAVAADLAPLSLRRAQITSLEIEKPRTMGVLTRQLDAASQRRRDVDDDPSLAAKLDAELLVVERRIELLEKRRDAHFLRSTRKGRVVSLDKQPGEIASPAEAVVRLVSATNRVVVCVPERRAFGLREGDSARLWLRGQRAEPLSGRTVALGPLVAELPARCWPTPKFPVWGREATVAVDAPIDVVAGEAFVVALESTPVAAPPSAGTPIAKAGAQSALRTEDTSSPSRPEPRLMTIPESLARRTRFEPSGILAQPGESRYLIVSDDTGIKDGPDDGRPWLFSMDRSGAVGATPVPIEGVGSIDDLESITAGDAGEIYVLSSQSYSRRGRRKPARSALLRLRASAGRIVVDGEVHLAEMLDLAPERAAALGLVNGTRSLDIEGMTFHDGALYLGVKAPLDAHGDAMIWKIASPGALFDAAGRGSKMPEASGMVAWGHARVDVDVDGKTVPGGISELLFTGADSLVITSTPSTAEGAAGALWHVDHATGGGLTPKLVERFPGRKPEGLAKSLVPGHLMVVFDAGSATPSFLEMPWPP
jgi:multidrug efflux pump subunit AcrA (membrane-fusion protein)